MANNNTYYWTFPAIDVYPSRENNTDVVYNIHWRLEAVDQTTTHSVETYGMQGVPPYNPDSGSFIPYSQLTQEQVTNWVMSAMGDRYGQLTSSLDNLINDLINPPSLQLAPPWTTPTPSPTMLPPPPPPSFMPYPSPTQTPTL